MKIRVAASQMKLLDQNLHEIEVEGEPLVPGSIIEVVEITEKDYVFLGSSIGPGEPLIEI